MKTLLLVPMVVLAGCADATAPTRTSPFMPVSADFQTAVSKATLPFSGTACNGETVTGTADRHTLVTFVNTPSGRMLSSINIDDKINGVGALTGVQYSGTDQTKTKAIDGDQGAGVFQLSSRLRLSGQKVPDTIVDISTMLVTNGNGEVVVAKAEFRTSCP
jgi:hypothetical protein